MLSEKQAREFIKPLQILFSLKKGLPNVIIAINTHDGMSTSELEEFKVDRFKDDPTYFSEVYIRDAEYMDSDFKPNCYMLCTWASMNMINVKDVPRGMSMEELTRRRDEFSEEVEVYHVGFFMKDFSSTLTMKEHDGVLSVLNPPGYVTEEHVNFIEGETSGLVNCMHSIFELR